MAESPVSPYNEKLKKRFEKSVDRSGEHHVWQGGKNPARGTGRIKVDKKDATAHRVAWELAYGPLPEATKVNTCPDEPLCVRLDHLSVNEVTGQKGPRGLRGAGSKRKLRPGVWRLEVTAGRNSDGTVRRESKRVVVSSSDEAAAELARFVAAVRDSPAAPNREVRKLNVDEAMELFLVEHLLGEKGREGKTVGDYRRIHEKWFSPHIGTRLVRQVEPEAIDKIFGRMRKAGLSRSRMNQAKSLYAPFFRWAVSRRMASVSPMQHFQLPTSSHIPTERMPPEVEELSVLLNEAVAVVPDITPLLVLGAVSGMRRGELTGLRRDRIIWNELRLTVDTAISESRNVKGTKTRKERGFYVDAATMEMLSLHCEQMDERAALFGKKVAESAFVFSLEPDCGRAIPPDYVTKRVAELKDHLGISNKSPEVMALEDKALKLRRQPPAPRAGRPGPAPTGGLSFVDIGKQLGRSERWALLAVRSAERRAKAKLRDIQLDFDGSIVALRKFTSSELLDAGFNITLVAQRQGHGPQVLVKHYAKGRRSADRKAAEHLGRVVHAKNEEVS